LSNALVDLFNTREGTLCGNCKVNIRAQGLARAILKSRFGYEKNTLKEWIVEANKHKLKVCELNSCHNLHDTLIKLRKLTYAEYGTPSEQNIEDLTYADNSFDIVLHSETLEHVNEPAKAMEECRRILKPNGLIIFTIPVIWSRYTRRRAKIENKKIKYTLSPSYHGFKTDDYLVFYEYGHDVSRLLKADVLYTDWKSQNYVFVSGKNGNHTSYLNKLKLRFLQQLAIRQSIKGANNATR
jgi:SAM-dependent methyltransferase